MSTDQNNTDEPILETDLQQKCDEYLLGWRRALADYDNLKKDLTKEKEEMRRNVKIQVAYSILPILDHFDSALKFKPDGLDQKTQNWLQGILHVRAQLEGALKEIGLEPFGNIGDLFNPHEHESVGEKEFETGEENSVIEVCTRGYKIGDYVVRPAKVFIKK